MDPILKRRLFTLLAITVSYFGTVQMAPRLFIANTPQINMAYIAELRSAPGRMVAFVEDLIGASARNNLAELKSKEVEEVPAGLQFMPMTKKVEAAQDPASGQKIIKVQAGAKFEVRSITLNNGKTVKIYIPLEE